MSSFFKKTFFYILLAYGLFGFLVLPYILKPQLTKIVSNQLNAKIEIGSLYINPFLFKVKLSDVQLFSLEDEELISFKSLSTDVELYSLFMGAIHIAELSLVEPKVLAVYNADKSFNLLKILKESETKTEETNTTLSLPRIIVDDVNIRSGKVFYEDYTRPSPFYFTFQNIGFELLNVDTDESEELQTTLRFYTTLGDGGFVDLQNKITSLKSLKTTGSLDFEASKLYTEWKYIRDMLALEVADGKVSLHTDYSFALEDINATKLEHLRVAVEKLRIKPKESYSDVLNIDRLFVEDTEVFPLKQSVVIGAAGIDGMRVVAKRDKDGIIDWTRYAAVNKEDVNATVDETQTKEESKPWNLLLKDLSLQNIAFLFDDATVTPQVETKIDKFNLHAQEITLLGEQPFSYTLDMHINDKGLCQSKGTVIHKELDIDSYINCQAMEISHYNPYIKSAAKKALKRFDLQLQSAELNFNAATSLQAHNGEISALIHGGNVTVNNFHLNKASTRQRLANFSSFSFGGIDVNTTSKEVEVANIALNSLAVNLSKGSNQKLNIEDLLVPKTQKNPSKNKTRVKETEAPYSVVLKHVSLNNGSLKFTDNSLEKTAVNSLKNIYFNAYNVESKKGSWIDYNLAMRINKAGKLATSGKLRHTPLKQEGKLSLDKLSLTALTPYIQEQAFVSVEDGKLSLNAQMQYEQKSSAPDLQVNGSLLLESLFVNDSLNNTQLLSLGDAKIHKYTLELNPQRLYVDEVDINSFYVDASIDENKTLNFSKLIKQSENNETESNTTTTETPSATEPFPYRVARVNVASGSAKFADYSIPIKFATHIHDLGGSIYAISNAAGETSYVDIAGEVDKYASTRLKGSVDSANPKAYTDLDFNFKNLDLNSFSGYSASFAGHEIESGKLYLDLGYDIVNSELLGSNSVIIEQIKLGKERDDENVTVLPLGFVIGLLEDSEGIIDINMPVEGNLDEPDFKYGQVVLKAIGTLITKAVTSPFKFLGAALGIDGEELEYVAFEPGSALITPPQREKLDQIESLMQKKPKIILGVAGEYELLKDKEALQMQKLVNLVVQKSGIKNIQDHESVMTIDMLEEIYKEQKDDDVLVKLQEHLQKENEDSNKYERAYNRALIKLCRDLQDVNENDLNELAQKRADAIINYLTVEKMLDVTRVNKKTTHIAEKSDEKYVKMSMEIEVK
ncbi:MAG: DUF748 domain-containing protein [Campylobacterales bacterium]|nr:DUF748 domain-containing protein [Campylobacterales bacterium]